MTVLHQATASDTGTIYTWTAESYDAGAGYTGTGTPENILVIAGMGPGTGPPGPTGPTGSASDSYYVGVSLQSSHIYAIGPIVDTPAGVNRWMLTDVLVRMVEACDASGSDPSVQLKIGTTNSGESFGTEILNTVWVTDLSVGDIAGGLDVSTLGSNLQVTTNYRAIYAAGQIIYVTVDLIDDTTNAAGIAGIYFFYKVLA